jgi:ATP-binding cassette subfamily B protein
MRHHGHSAPAHEQPSAASANSSPAPRTDGKTLQRLLPYLWAYKWRVILALGFMIGAKLANVSVPILLKNLIDTMAFKPGDPAAVLVVPAGLLLAYGGLRLTTSASQSCASWCLPKPHRGRPAALRCKPSSTCMR